MLRRFILPATAAALAMMATAPLIAHQVEAHPAMPILPGDTPMERLQTENRMLRQQLQLAMNQQQEIAIGLERLEQLARTSRDGRTGRRMASLIHDLEARLSIDDQWQDDGYGYGQNQPPYGPPMTSPGYPSTPPGYPPSTGPGYPSTPPSTGYPPSYPQGPGTIIVGDRRTQAPVAMNASDFGALLATVSGAGFTDQQLAIVRGAAQRSYFTVDQVVSLLGIARFEEARIEMAVAVGARVVDPERWFLIERAFSFSGSAETVRQRLGR